MKNTYKKIRDIPLYLQRSDDVPYDQRILDLINKCGAKNPSARPTAQKALDGAITIDAAIKTETVVEDIIQNLVDVEDAKQGAKRVSALVENHFLKIKKKRTLTRWVRSLKADAKFEVRQLE